MEYLIKKFEIDTNEIVEYEDWREDFDPRWLIKIEPNARIGGLTLICLDHVDARYNKYWLCRCDCGQSKAIRVDNLKSGKVKTCGCGQGLPTVGRPNQMSSRRINPDDARYTVDIYTTPGRISGNRVRARDDRIQRHDFVVIRAVGKRDPDYQMTNVTARHSSPGQVPPAMSATLGRMARAKLIQERGNRTVPEWAKDEGVDVIVHRVGNTHDLRAAHDAMEGEAIANGYNPKKMAKPLGGDYET